MDLLDLFKPNQPFEKVHIRPNIPSPTKDEFLPLESQLKTPLENKDYYKKYVEEENEIALQAIKLSNGQKDGGKIDELSVGTTPTCVGDVDQEKIKIYNEFDFEYRPKDTLPIVQSQNDIMSMIETHSVTIIEGVTGCGKSTQVPQFILDHCYKQRQHCNIIVTQPRRIAALSIADRVSKERGWRLGTIVGVQVGMFRQISNDTRLTYCTTGVLLRKLIQAKNLLEYTHVILDEVHERDQEMDFLLLIIRKLLRTNSRQVKVILMSATFDITKFSEYFSVPTEHGFVRAPIVSIPKKRNFKVHVHYLDQLHILGALPEISLDEPKITQQLMKFCMVLINVFDDIDNNSEYDAEDLAEFGGEKPRYATLIFLPGIWEIEEMHDLMIQDKLSSKWDIVILHSSITSEEQNKIFTAPPKGCRRIILSTNIAESSITINNIKYVIDFCLTKQLVTDPTTNFQCLELTWASKANCEQRAGRAGRVMDGRVYRLLPKENYELLPSEGDPEIVRAPLENLVLQTKLLDMGEPKAVLALAIDPPDLSNLERTVLLLKEAGGLLDKPNVFNRFDGDLTDLGRIMAALPMEIHLAKLIALGHVFGVLRDTIIMAAAMSVKSMFSNPFQKRIEAYYAKVHWADGSTSDCLTYLNAFRVWQRNIASHFFKKKHKTEKNWAQTNFIQIKVIHEIDYLVSELTQRLERLGIKETEGGNKIVSDEVDRSYVLKIIIAGAFYPNYFIRNQSSNLNADGTQGAKALGGLDPTRTVFLQGWNPDQPGRLYSKRIQKLFENVVPAHEQTIVEFDGSSRVYLMFPDDKAYGNEKDKLAKIPGKVSLSVYKALKLRKLKPFIQFPVMDVRSAKRYAEEIKLPTNPCSMMYSKDNFIKVKKFLPSTLPLLPSLDLSVIALKVVHIEHPNKFWVRMNDKDTWINLSKIENFLNDPKNITLKPVEPNLPIGSLVAAKWINDKMYRVIVESLYKLKGQDVANVFFIDCGYRTNVQVTELKTINPNHEIYSMRAMAFESTLTAIEPSKRRDARGLWSQKAIEEFCKYTNEPYTIYGTIYSVVDSIVSLRLTCTNSQNLEDSINLNDLLVKEGLADSVEEHYLSNYNHQLRESVNDQKETHREYLEYLQYDKSFLIRTYPDPPPIEDCRFLANLRGPFSPLEISLSSLAVNASTKKVNVDNLSVNSILLDTDPEDPHDRLLVASVVSQNTSGTNLTLRNTTLMPNIAGLTAIICLIFAPKIELRRSLAGTYYVGALCGLGYNTRNGAALLPEHDIEVYFDTEISIEDIQNVNRLRHWMNLGICVKTNEIDAVPEDAIRCQRKAMEFLKTLTDRPIKDQNPERLLNFYRWGLYNDALFLHPTKAVIKEDSVFPLHCALELEDRNESKEMMAMHMHELRLLASSDPRIKENIDIYCELCEEHMYGRESLRIHLYAENHKTKEKALDIKKSYFG